MHREIYRAIRARKPAEARRLMDQHLRMAQAAQGMERSAERKPAQANGKREKGRGEASLHTIDQP
jgi:GntR family transcriptional repressor for pyruvate dehydrogenase complex